MVRGNGAYGLRIRERTMSYLSLLVVALVALASWFIPLEEILSAYPFYSSFSWYPTWRVAVASLLTWIALMVLVGSGFPYLALATAFSASLFALFHYATLYDAVREGFEVGFLPLLYYSNWNGKTLYYLDMGQLVALLTAAQLLYTLKSRSSPKK